MDYESLRRQLIADRPPRVPSDQWEDIVQQVLVEALEAEAKGVAIINPLHWCRMHMKWRRMKDHRQRVVRAEAEAALTAFGVPLGTLSRQDKDRERKRRKRKATA